MQKQIYNTQRIHNKHGNKYLKKKRSERETRAENTQVHIQRGANRQQVLNRALNSKYTFHES